MSRAAAASGEWPCEEAPPGLTLPQAPVCPEHLVWFSCPRAIPPAGDLWLRSFVFVSRNFHMPQGKLWKVGSEETPGIGMNPALPAHSPGTGIRCPGPWWRQCGWGLSHRARPDISSQNPITTFHVEATSHPGTPGWRRRDWSETGHPETWIPGHPSRQKRGHRRGDGASPAWRAWPRAWVSSHVTTRAPCGMRSAGSFECMVGEERPWKCHSLWNGAGAGGEESEPGRRVLWKTARVAQLRTEARVPHLWHFGFSNIYAVKLPEYGPHLFSAFSER